MGGHKIPELNRRLEQMRSFLSTSSQTFLQNVRVSTQRFTEQDRMDFDDILAEIRQFAMKRFLDFINTRITTKTTSFVSHFNAFKDSSTDLRANLDKFRGELQQASRKLKTKEIAKEQLLERVSDKYATTQSYKKVMRAFKSNADRRRKKKQLERKMQKVYEEKLMQKCFFPWRALTYKDGYENQVKKHTQAQLRKIHNQFGDIVDVLRQKILETEELIKIKRAAKGEFAYALSKNLLKTISNLSLQVAAKDRANEQQTTMFMNQVNKLIQTRLQSVVIHKETMYSSQAAQRQNQQPQEPRELPLAMTSPLPKPKRISFA